MADTHANVINRALRLVAALDGRELTMDQIVRRVGYSRATVWRMIASLRRDFGVVIIFTGPGRSPYGRYRITDLGIIDRQKLRSHLLLRVDPAYRSERAVA